LVHRRVHLPVCLIPRVIVRLCLKRATIDAFPPYEQAMANSAQITGIAWGVDRVAGVVVTVE
jgi:hypothetical protein